MIVLESNFAKEIPINHHEITESPPTPKEKPKNTEVQRLRACCRNSGMGLVMVSRSTG
jgi:hypothetical protein